MGDELREYSQKVLNLFNKILLQTQTLSSKKTITIIKSLGHLVIYSVQEANAMK